MMDDNRSTSLQNQTNSYMHLIIHVDGDDDLELKVPTFLDSITNKWIGAIKLPISNKLITATGKDSLELQNSFNKELHDILHNKKFSDELVSLFTKVKKEKK